MLYEITITPKPFIVHVATLSGPDVAEELARRAFLITCENGATKEPPAPWAADHSKAAVRTLDNAEADKLGLDRNAFGVLRADYE